MTKLFGWKAARRDILKMMKHFAAEEDVVEVRQEDKTIRNFVIPCQEDLEGRILTLTSVSVVRNHKLAIKKVNVTLKKKEKLLLVGPNGIGKTTLLGALATGNAKGEELQPGVFIGYYRQDFSMLDFDKTVYSEAADAAQRGTEEDMRSVAAGFLLDAEILKTRIGLLSEGQKGLVAFAKLVLERPGLLLLDEPIGSRTMFHLWEDHFHRVGRI